MDISKCLCILVLVKGDQLAVVIVISHKQVVTSIDYSLPIFVPNKGGFTLRSKSKKLGAPKTSLNEPYLHTQDWTQIWWSTSHTRRNIVLSWDRQDLVGKWCHINTISLSHTLDPYPSVNFLGPNFGCWPTWSLDLGVSLVLDPHVVNPPAYDAHKYRINDWPTTMEEFPSW